MNHSEFRAYPELKEKIHNAGFSILQIAQQLQEPYSNLAGRLNGYLRLSKEMHREIEQICFEAGNK